MIPVPLSLQRTGALLLLSGILLTGCSHQLAPEGHYQDTPVAADGSPSDWKLPLRFSDESYNLQYNVTNDDKGSMCLGILRSDSWKPSCKISQVLEMVVGLLVEPNAYVSSFLLLYIYIFL